MKKSILFTAIILLFATLQSFAQDKDGKELPAVDLKTMEGDRFNTGDLENDGKPIVISFWATWCKPCILELSNIHDLYPDWQDETGVKIVAVSIDDVRNSSKVMPFVHGKGWEYEVLLDENGDFKRAMNVNNVPTTFLLNADKEIVWMHTSYAPGDEEELYEQILEVAGEE